MSHVSPNPQKHPKMTFGSRHCAEKIRTKHILKVDSNTLLLHTSLFWNQFFYYIFVQNKFAHQPHLENSSEVPFVLFSYLREKTGLRIDIIFLNNTEVCAF